MIGSLYINILIVFIEIPLHNPQTFFVEMEYWHPVIRASFLQLQH